MALLLAPISALLSACSPSAARRLPDLSYAFLTASNDTVKRHCSTSLSVERPSGRYEGKSAEKYSRGQRSTPPLWRVASAVHRVKNASWNQSTTSIGNRHHVSLWP